MSEYPALENFLDAYFNQDWTWQYSTLREGVVDFVTGNTEGVRELREELEHLLKVNAVEELEDGFLEQLGGDLLFRDRRGEYRFLQWLLAFLKGETAADFEE